MFSDKLFPLTCPVIYRTSTLFKLEAKETRNAQKSNVPFISSALQDPGIVISVTHKVKATNPGSSTFSPTHSGEIARIDLAQSNNDKPKRIWSACHGVKWGSHVHESFRRAWYYHGRPTNHFPTI